MPVLPDLDHIVYAGPSLEAAIDAVEAATGVRARPGGRHPTGTANALIAFTVDGARAPHYLEIIGPDAERGVKQADVATFGISSLREPVVAAYGVRAADIDGRVRAARAAGVDLGDVFDLSRTTADGELLEWRLTPADRSGLGAIVPFLIDWGSTPHPSQGDLPALELVSFSLEHPAPRAARTWLDAVGVATPVAEGPAPALVVEVAGPHGVVRLGGAAA